MTSTFVSEKSRRDRRGFGLIGVIALAALVSLVMLAIGTLLNSSLVQLKRSSLKSEANSLKAQVEEVIQRNAACIHNLKILNLISFGSAPQYALTKIMQESSAVAFTTPVISGLGIPPTANSRLIVSSMEITNHGATTAPVPVLVTASTKLFLTDLRITLQAATGQVSARPLVIGVIRIETDLTGDITNCELIPPGNPSDLCTDLGLVWDSTFNDCMGTATQICAGIGGTLDAFNKCITNPPLNVACPVDSFSSGYISGNIRCTTPSITGIWSDWSICASSVQTRSCLVGTCTGPASQACL